MDLIRVLLGAGVCWVVMGTVSCNSESAPGGDADTDTDTDADADTDTDSDSDTDTDTDTDSHTDTDTDTDSDTDTDTDTDTDSDTDADTDTDSDSDTDSDTGTDPDSDTGSPVDTDGFDNRTPVEPTVTEEGGEGNVTTYGNLIEPEPSTGGACNYGVTGIYSFAAINVHVTPGDYLGQWDDGQMCGQCAEVWAETPWGIKTTVVRVVDRCADVHCGIDLGGLPAQQLMGTQAGRYDGGWRFVPCVGVDDVSDGPTAIFVKEGSNPHWAVIQIRNPPARILSVDWASDTDAGSLTWAIEAENFLVVPEAVRGETGSVTLTITYDFDLSDTLVTTGTALTEEKALIPI